jgi:hypothetical protein
MTERERRAAIALGICIVSLAFIVETVLAHRLMPSPLSPIVWTVLGSVAAASLGVYLRLTWLDRRR